MVATLLIIYGGRLHGSVQEALRVAHCVYALAHDGVVFGFEVFQGFLVGLFLHCVGEGIDVGGELSEYLIAEVLVGVVEEVGAFGVSHYSVVGCVLVFTEQAFGLAGLVEVVEVFVAKLAEGGALVAGLDDTVCERCVGPFEGTVSEVGLDGLP